MEERVVICPCCDRPAKPRAEPITPAECVKALARMKRKGWTAARLLAERRADLDFIAPGLTDYLQAVALEGPE